MSPPPQSPSKVWASHYDLVCRLASTRRAWYPSAFRGGITSVVQEVIVKAYCYSREGTSQKTPGYFARVLFTTLMDRLRGRRAASIDAGDADTPPLRDTLVAVQDAPDGRLAEAEELERLRRTLLLLPKQERDVLQLNYLKGYSVKAIAEELGVSDGYIRNVRQSGLRRLRRLLRDTNEARTKAPSRDWEG